MIGLPSKLAFMLTFGLIVPGIAISHVEDGLYWSLDASSRSGTINATSGGTQFEVGLTMKADSPMLVYIPCKNNSPPQDSVLVDNFIDVINDISTAKTSSIQPKETWKICARDEYLILNGSNTKSTSLYFEVINPIKLIEDGAVAANINASGYYITQEQARTYALNPLDLWKIISDNDGSFTNSHLNVEPRLNVKFSGDSGKLSWSITSYEDAFGDATEFQGTAEATISSLAQPVRLSEVLGNGIVPIEFSNAAQSAAFNKKNLQIAKKSLYKTSQGSSLLKYSQSETSESADAIGLDDLAVENQTSRLRSRASARRIVSNGTTIKGRIWAVWGSDNIWHPGLGLKVAAYGKRNANSNYDILLGSAIVDDRGRYLINMSGNTDISLGIKVIAKTSSNYFKMVNSNNSIYQAYDYKTISDNERVPGAQNTYRINLFIDNPKWRSGVAESSYYIANVWKDYVNRLGVDPVFYSGNNPIPIKVIYPNTKTSECSSTDPSTQAKIPWSCSSGKVIWYTQEHGLQWDTIAHELAHSLNSKFWGGRLPAGAGGNHSINTCYPGYTSPGLGMALTEGFADFMAVWHGYRAPSRDTNFRGTGIYPRRIGYNVEAPPNLNDCQNGIENELLVAKTFWDLYDFRQDSSIERNPFPYIDDLGFVNGELVPLEFLNTKIPSNGATRTMAWYYGQYADLSNNSRWIDNVFNLNRTAEGPDRTHTIEIGIR